jgi:hypothetical protein
MEAFITPIVEAIATFYHTHDEADRQAAHEFLKHWLGSAETCDPAMFILTSCNDHHVRYYAARRLVLLLQRSLRLVGAGGIIPLADLSLAQILAGVDQID